jgi:hypothetical protein
MDYGLIDYHTYKSNMRVDKILLDRKKKQLIKADFYKGKLNDNKKVNLNDKKTSLKNDYSNNLLINNANQIIRHNKTHSKPDIILNNHIKNVKGKIVDIPSINLDRFFPLMKDPQINCLEKFVRGGENTVLKTLDNFKC